MSKKADDEHVRRWNNHIEVDSFRDFEGTLEELQVLVAQAIAKYGKDAEVGLFGECCFGEGAGLVLFKNEGQHANSM